MTEMGSNGREDKQRPVIGSATDEKESEKQIQEQIRLLEAEELKCNLSQLMSGMLCLSLSHHWTDKVNFRTQDSHPRRFIVMKDRTRKTDHLLG